MIICKTVASLQYELAKRRLHAQSIGFVPTMGALHQGHISLVKLSKQQGNFTVSSVFVNPTQFNDPKDFEQYPITIEQDILMLEQAGCDMLFLPQTAEVYPNGLTPTRNYDLGYLELLFEGSYRPGHFQGVCQVVHRLLEIVQPQTLFLGQKDYQQCMVIRKLITLIEIPTTLVIGPTLRETNGLAMSSRNKRLSATASEQATAIYKALQLCHKQLAIGPLTHIEDQAKQLLMEAGFEKIDYLSFANAITLQPVNNWEGKEQLVVVVAAFLQGVRLIDNMVLN
jgi:pantoate--beta-alanine ligase